VNKLQVRSVPPSSAEEAMAFALENKAIRLRVWN
jgi:hypothetical protein